MSGLLLDVQDLDVFYGRSQILFGVSLELHEGQTVALLGRNGAGKSTTMKAIAGLVRVRRGAIFMTGRDLTVARAHVRARAGLGYVPEDRQVFPEHSVQDNLLIAAKKGPQGQDHWTLERVWQVFPLLQPLRHRAAGLLSGGEQQMLAIARTLMCNPVVLLLDEPSEGLAPVVVARITELLRQLRANGATVLLAEQNMHFCLGIASDAAVIDKGHIVHRGTIAALRADEEVRRRYLAL
jgi:branched-chain amino acid transport system ATP-binding protein